VLTIAYRAGDSCAHEDGGSPWAGAAAQQLFQQMAMHSLRFFSARMTSDRAATIQAIGAQLATGSRLEPTLQKLVA